MKKLRKDERKASSRQYAAKRFMVLNVYLQIAYYLQVTRYDIARIPHRKSLTLGLPATLSLARRAGILIYFSPGPDLIFQDVVQHRQIMKYYNINRVYQTSRTRAGSL